MKFQNPLRPFSHPLLATVCLVGFSVIGIGWVPLAADETVRTSSSAERGYRFLTEHPVLTSDFSQDTFDQVWQSWPEPLRRQAETATLQERRAMAFERYGLTTRPDDDSGKPLQYVVDDDGTWTMNCFSCHGGSVYGKSTPGAPNNRFALQTMTEEIRSTKFKLGRPFSRMDMGALFIPLGTTHGTTNAVVFGMGLMSSRDADLNVVNTPPTSFTHHDMDAPPWWTFHKRPYLYIDGFAEKGHRGLMQFTLIPENGPEFYRENENAFRDVYDYLASLRPPKYEGEVNVDLAEQGRVVFNQTCAECHGTYDRQFGGDDWTYPNRRIPINDIGTDPVRLKALSVEGRKKYASSWFANVGQDDQQDTIVAPDGYVAPPLDGIWASPPYFHNGSVPTLWHVLHPTQRPQVWRRISEAIDDAKMGFSIEVVDKVPLTHPDVAVRRTYFDTRRFGKSNQGHDYPDLLSEDEKNAVLEYLKTL
ncbi:Cytochrome c [Rubripirellula amarantea]|uniref:Cytochrome c n=2 Tax=Rubripirellula amarantea TaxID=2527999 RepID=A0A5C5WSZ3_9BACT|nr:Cytochrome c [Rubripirellula amarantea]